MQEYNAKLSDRRRKRKPERERRVQIAPSVERRSRATVRLQRLVRLHHSIKNDTLPMLTR